MDMEDGEDQGEMGGFADAKQGQGQGGGRGKGGTSGRQGGEGKRRVLPLPKKVGKKKSK